MQTPDLEKQDYNVSLSHKPANIIDDSDDGSEDDATSALTDPLDQEFHTTLALAGMRLDLALAKLLPMYSRSRLSGLIQDQAVWLDGVCATPKTRLKGSEVIRVKVLPRPEETAFEAEEMDLDIIYEDDFLLVLNKAPGIVVHPANGNWEGTLLNGLLYHVPNAASLPRAGIVHRLDKDTSGIMVVAKTEPAQQNLVRQLQSRTVKREYVALVQGEVEHPGTIQTGIGRHPKNRTKMAVVPVEAGGKLAITHYSTLEHFEFHSLVQCKLETGRTHQIRVHMLHGGRPIEGDLVYGGTIRGLSLNQQAVLHNFPRQALHARRLGFIHPDTNKPVKFEAPIPDDMEDLIDEVADW